MLIFKTILLIEGLLYAKSMQLWQNQLPPGENVFTEQ